MHMGTEEGDHLVFGLTTTVDGSAPHRVFVVFYIPIGMAVVIQNAFTVQIAILVDVARPHSDNGGAPRCREPTERRPQKASLVHLAQEIFCVADASLPGKK